MLRASGVNWRLLMLNLKFAFLACAIWLAVLLGGTQLGVAGLLTNPLATTVLPQVSDQFAGNDNSYLHEVRRGKRRLRRHSRRSYRGHRRSYRGHRRYNRRHARRSYRNHRRHNYRRYSRRSYYPGFYFAPLYPPTVYIEPAPTYREGECSYWARQCERNWNTRSDFIGCMRYQGCL